MSRHVCVMYCVLSVLSCCFSSYLMSFIDSSLLLWAFRVLLWAFRVHGIYFFLSFQVLLIEWNIIWSKKAQKRTKEWRFNIWRFEAPLLQKDIGLHYYVIVCRYHTRPRSTSPAYQSMILVCNPSSLTGYDSVQPNFTWFDLVCFESIQFRFF